MLVERRVVCIVRSQRVEANRVRKRQARNRSAVAHKLPSVIDTLITAVRNGELDQQFADASKQSNPRKSKRAA